MLVHSSSELIQLQFSTRIGLQTQIMRKAVLPSIDQGPLLLTTCSLVDKQMSESKAKDLLFELSNEAPLDFSSQVDHPLRVIRHPRRPSSPRQSPTKMNQTFQARKISAITTQSFRSRVVDMVDNMNPVKCQPKSCLNFSYYMIIDQRPQRSRVQNVRSQRPSSIKRPFKFRSFSRQKRCMLLENNLMTRSTIHQRDEEFRKTNYYGFLRTIKL